MDYNSRIIGIVVGMLRTQKGLTQEELSGLAGIARSHLAMIENGRKKANVETLWRIAEALEIRLSEMIYLVEEHMKIRKHTE